MLCFVFCLFYFYFFSIWFDFFFFLSWNTTSNSGRIWHASRAATPDPVLIIHPWFAETGKLIILSVTFLEGKKVRNICRFSLLVDVSLCLGGTTALLLHNCSQIMIINVCRSRACVAIRPFWTPSETCRFSVGSPIYRVILLSYAGWHWKHIKAGKLITWITATALAFCWERLAFPWMFFSLRPSSALSHTE